MSPLNFKILSSFLTSFFFYMYLLQFNRSHYIKNIWELGILTCLPPAFLVFLNFVTEKASSVALTDEVLDLVWMDVWMDR